MITKKVALLQNGAGITNWAKSCYKVGQLIYYKVGQSLLPSGVGIMKWGKFTTKWNNDYRKNRYKWRPMLTDRANAV